MPRLDPRLVPVLTSLDLRDGDGNPVSAVGCGEPLEFHLAYAAPGEITNPSFGIIISNGMGMPLFFLQTRAQLGLWDKAPPGRPAGVSVGRRAAGARRVSADGRLFERRTPA